MSESVAPDRYLFCNLSAQFFTVPHGSARRDSREVGGVVMGGRHSNAAKAQGAPGWKLIAAAVVAALIVGTGVLL